MICELNALLESLNLKALPLERDLKEDVKFVEIFKEYEIGDISDEEIKEGEIVEGEELLELSRYAILKEFNMTIFCLQRIGLYVFVVDCEVKAQIRRIFLLDTAYSMSDQQTLRFLRVSWMKVSNDICKCAFRVRRVLWFELAGSSVLVRSVPFYNVGPWGLNDLGGPKVLEDLVVHELTTLSNGGYWIRVIGGTGARLFSAGAYGCHPSFTCYSRSWILGDGIVGQSDVRRMRATLDLLLLYGLPHCLCYQDTYCVL
ncbi:hypothetical protein Tco_0052072 [Tanacetum coccineum]